MRKIIILFCLFFLNPCPTFAHEGGGISFFTINGVATEENEIPPTHVSGFSIPQDKAPKLYLINSPLLFAIDPDKLPFPDDQIHEMTFHWDFGDGTRGEGLTTTHKYATIGSYILSVKRSGSVGEEDSSPSEIQSVLIHIVPELSYKLPRAVITLNNLTPTEKDNSLNFLYTEKIIFDGARSLQGSSPISSYTWSLGNGKSLRDKTFSYSYSAADPRYIFPVLRVEDENGFMSDTYVQIELDSPDNVAQPRPNLLIIGAVLISGALVTILLIAFRKKS